MTEIRLRAIESTRRTASLPPGVDGDVSVRCYGEESRTDYTFDVRALRAFDVRAVREIRARMIIRHSMMMNTNKEIRGRD